VGHADHANYSKRVMARDQVRLMQALGFGHFDVLAMYEQTSCAFATAYWHWLAPGTGPTGQPSQ
jgi:haloacetate dehalogenase